MERYFVAALIVGGLVAIGVGAIRRRGVPPAKFEVEAELVRQGIVAAPHATAKLSTLKALDLREQVGAIQAGMLVMAEQSSQQVITARTIAAQQRRQVMVYMLLNDPMPSADAIAQADLAIRRARHPHPPLQ